ncbi:MAG: hypothetical protein LQ350_006475 [Teloschistes chrysophthalmus]|nr:MAG: hypothetical protein LQ350_006475 [Niorma chrysophthalma]
MSTTTPIASPPNYPVQPFEPPPPGTPYPYTPSSFTRMDNTPDGDFYSQPRFVTHIDDAAIARLRTYYLHNLPRTGRVLDLCSSWISHFPPELENAAVAKNKRNSEQEKVDGEGLEVVGLGMNKAELDANPILHTRILQDLNTHPTLPTSLIPPTSTLDATTCVVSIDYLTRPVEVLKSILDRTCEGGKVHLVISNRCFPTKVVGRWLRVGEMERLEMVAGYLWWAGWRGVEVVDVMEEGGEEQKGWMGRLMGAGGDPLWVVRGTKVEEGGGAVAHAEL